jgi:hypothetical protein
MFVPANLFGGVSLGRGFPLSAALKAPTRDQAKTLALCDVRQNLQLCRITGVDPGLATDPKPRMGRA